MTWVINSNELLLVYVPSKSFSYHSRPLYIQCHYYLEEKISKFNPAITTKTLKLNDPYSQRDFKPRLTKHD